MRILAFDLGLNVGWALVGAGERPLAGSFRIEHPATDLGAIGQAFQIHASAIMDRLEPDAIARAARFINRFSNPVSIGPLYGLSMLLDMMADDYRLPSYEVAESDARKAFLSAVPRKSKEIKAAVMSACALRGWPALDSHSCDAIVVALHVLAHLEPGTAVEATPLFQGDRRCTDGRKANATTLSRRGRATQPAS